MRELNKDTEIVLLEHAQRKAKISPQYDKDYQERLKRCDELYPKTLPQEYSIENLLERLQKLTDGEKYKSFLRRIVANYPHFPVQGRAYALQIFKELKKRTCQGTLFEDLLLEGKNILDHLANLASKKYCIDEREPIFNGPVLNHLTHFPKQKDLVTLDQFGTVRYDIAGGFDGNGLSIIIEGFRNSQKMQLMRPTTHCLLMLGISEFTKINNIDSVKSGEFPPCLEIRLPLDQYIRLIGYNVDIDETQPIEKEKARINNIRQYVKGRILEDIEILRQMRLNFKERICGKLRPFKKLGILGTSSMTFDGRTIILVFDLMFANYLIGLAINQFHAFKMLKFTNNQANAYTIAFLSGIHYYIKNNIDRGTHNRLKVKTLLQYTDLPSYEECKNTRQSWNNRIRQPLEEMLDFLKSIEFFDRWEYTAENGIPIQDEYSAENYSQWADWNVHFEIKNPVSLQKILKKPKNAKIAKKSRKKLNNFSEKSQNL